VRLSTVDFIRQQGFSTEDCQDGLFAALMFQPRVITGLVIAGAVLQSPWLFLALAAVLWWGALVPRRNPFDVFVNRVMTRRIRLAAMPTAPSPRRFSQAMAGTFALSVALARLAGMLRTAWLLEAVFVVASTSVVARRMCLPAYIYGLLWPGTPVTPCPQLP
jgi:hypothetical protein